MTAILRRDARAGMSATGSTLPARYRRQKIRPRIDGRRFHFAP
jgi:hypothetical protein